MGGRLTANGVRTARENTQRETVTTHTCRGSCADMHMLSSACSIAALPSPAVRDRLDIHNVSKRLHQFGYHRMCHTVVPVGT